MSLSLWTVNCRGIPKELLAPAVRWRQALDASAIHGRLGAQVALLQSPILPDACSPYNKRPNFRDFPLTKPHTRRLVFQNKMRSDLVGNANLGCQSSLIEYHQMRLAVAANP